MDPWNSAQDVVRCTLCQTTEAPMYCKVCHIHLCKDCVQKHSYDSSKVHNVVSLKQVSTTLNYPICKKHPNKQCELHCERCDKPICTQCNTGEHLGHKQVDISEIYERNKEVLQTDLQELLKYIYPQYIDIASNISMQKADLMKNSERLTTDLNEQGELWHREIDTIIRNLKSDLDEMESNHLHVLNKQEDDITSTMSEIRLNIAKLKKLLNSKDTCLFFEYKSTNAKFRKLPSKIITSLPNLRLPLIYRDQLIEQFGSLSALSFTTKEQYYTMPPQGAESSPLDQELMDEARVILSIDTKYEYGLCSVTCLNDEEIWTCGEDSIMRLYNLRGELLKSIQTKSNNWPDDITVTRFGDLIYTDYEDRTVNIVKNTQIQTLIRLKGWISGWKPRGVCSSSSGDLLVVTDNDNSKQTKVVRFSGSTRKQNIQYKDKGQPLYSFGGEKYIDQNRNLDICVSDREARAIVVVNQAGNFRFTYTGPPSTTNGSFNPRGITTDSQSQILVADGNNRIHILDQDGQFLRYINKCNLDDPWGLCVDTRDNLFVAEFTGKVKKIHQNM